MATDLGRSVSTVSREISRNRGVDGYRAVRADRLAVVRAARPRPGKLASHDRLRTHVEAKLALCWSPQQISPRLVVEFPKDEQMRVSHETIYTSLFVQTRPGLRADLTGSSEPAGFVAIANDESRSPPNGHGSLTWCL